MVSKKQCAKQRIQILFEEAKKIYGENPRFAHRYAEIAWNIALKTNTSFQKQQKIRFCRNCKSYLQPGKNVTYRLQNKNLVKTCNECNTIRRYRYKHIK